MSFISKNCCSFKSKKSDEIESYILLWQKHGSTSIAWFPEKEKSNADYREYWNAKMDCATEWRHIWEDRSGAKSELGMDGWLQSEEVGGWHLSCTQLLQTTGVPLSALHLDSLCLVRDTHWNYSVRRTAFKRVKFLPYDCCLANTLKIWFKQYLHQKHFWRGQHFKVIHIV